MLARKATLNMSDLHYGDGGQLHAALQGCVERAIQTVLDFQPDEKEVICNGDTAAGRGIFRRQEATVIAQLGSEQVWYAAWEVKGWHERLKATRWIFVDGNHDNAHGENLAIQLVAMLQLLGVPAYYAGRTYTGNFALVEAPGQWYEAEHGFGGSDYYATSYTAIRAAARKFMQRVKRDKIELSRLLYGHTHWIETGKTVGDDYCIDVTGGWHAQRRHGLAADIRRTGMIAYLHDSTGGPQGTLDVREIVADQEAVVAETRDVGLVYKNMAAAAAALSQCAEWARSRGLA